MSGAWQAMCKWSVNNVSFSTSIWSLSCSGLTDSSFLPRDTDKINEGFFAEWHNYMYTLRYTLHYLIYIYGIMVFFDCWLISILTCKVMNIFENTISTDQMFMNNYILEYFLLCLKLFPQQLIKWFLQLMKINICM